MAYIYAPIIDTRIHVGYDRKLEIRFKPNPAIGTTIKDLGLVVLPDDGRSSTDEKKFDNGIADYTKQENGYYIATFSISDVNEGSFYRIKICYGDNSVDNTYSELGTMKYTGIPSIGLNLSGSTLTANYSNTSDTTEPLVYYSVYDKDYAHDVIEGVFVGNSMEIQLNHYPYKNNNDSKIQFIGTTLNGAVVESVIDKTDLYPTSFETKGFELNTELGVIKFSESGSIIKNKEVLTTESESTNFDSTFSSGEITEYVVVGVVGSTGYKLNKPILENIVLSDHEHILPIKFNPKVSSYKTVIQETKLETMGSKYPYIFRNDAINYKELPLSGLLSYLEDDASSFITNTNSTSLIFNNINKDDPAGDKEDSVPNEIINQFGDTGLSDQNIALELEFKNKVMAWLNNGKPKLLRTPTEGSFIVRLMNVSLSPNETLGRMLHTFSCTAYEIAEFNSNNIRKYNLIWREKNGQV